MTRMGRAMTTDDVSPATSASTWSSAPPDSTPSRMLSRVSPMWQVALGVVTVVAGWAAMLWPGRTVFVLAVIVGIQLVLAGLVGLIVAIGARGPDTEARVLAVIVGLSLLVVGVLCLRHRVVTIESLTLLLGLAWLVAGVVELYRAATGKDDRLVTGISGVLSIALGIVILAWPVASIVAAAWVIGGGLVVLGVMAIVRGFRARASHRSSRTSHAQEARR